MIEQQRRGIDFPEVQRLRQQQSNDREFLKHIQAMRGFRHFVCEIGTGIMKDLVASTEPEKTLRNIIDFSLHGNVSGSTVLSIVLSKFQL